MQESTPSRNARLGEPQQVYHEIASSINDALQRQVLEYFKDRPGQAIRREQAISDLFGRTVERSKLAADRNDRKLRLAIAALQKQGYPILASAKAAGYCYSTDPAQLEAYLAELESRRRELE